MFVLSVESVINYIETKWKKNKILSGKYLNYKLVMLIPLTSASKASAMHCLEVSFMVKSEDAYIFPFYKLQKSWRKGEALPKLQNYVFISTQKIKNCVWCLPYISTWSVQNNRGQIEINFRGFFVFFFLLIYISSHMDVHSWTVSRWMKESGNDVDTFKGHSTRSASTSKVKSIRCFSDDILSRESWSNDSTWQKFYRIQVP